ncbi:MAG TPA: molybdopterin molybdotransferase MoeA [Woeseiaceae bacterium]|nr:molybdopterin molybdotransferase MoeA [Woeseiaceae bacterium]
MITTAEAMHAILASVRKTARAPIPLAQATGRVLQQDVVAERDQPPFDRVMMDGIAISYAAFAAGQRQFAIQATQAAGDVVLTLEPGHAIEIMTGATLPDGADCIVPVERISVRAGTATIAPDYDARAHQFIHPRASDHEKGSLLLQPGTRIGPMEVAIIASAGLAEVEVAVQPSISVISTGNELVAAGQPIDAHQVRQSNGPAVIAMLEEHGYANAHLDHLADDLDVLRTHLRRHLEQSDILVLSGGVSMGKADFIPQVLEELGVQLVFHKISQRPGKPMWFGIGPAAQAVFALPGNPVSTIVCCRQYVLPALRHMNGMRPLMPQFAALTQDVNFAPRLTSFLPVKLLSNAAGQTLAMPVQTNTSGDFTALGGTDGYVELALEQSTFKAGAVVPLHRWRM